MKIIGTTEISYEIEKILKESQDYLILVTPYLKLNQRLKVKLSDAFKKDIRVYLIHRRNELNPKDSQWLKNFENVRLFPINNLHSKIYGNEETILICSMNLYEYSQINNHEIGVRIESWDDEKEYFDSLNEIRIILESEHPHSYHKFDDIIDSNKDYSMGKLFHELTSKYEFNIPKNENQTLYEYISSISREIVEFRDFELYQDETAILRRAQLGKERYNLLEKELKKIAN